MPDAIQSRPATAAVMPSRVAETAPAAPVEAVAHFTSRLTFETDPSDLHADLVAGAEVVVIDARDAAAYRHAHIPGAISLPLQEVTAETTRGLNSGALLVVYCTGPGCNASTKGALRLAGLGLPVKELIGGIEYWRREGYPLASGEEPGALDTTARYGTHASGNA